MIKYSSENDILLLKLKQQLEIHQIEI